jgi:hypothetical protein
MPPKRSAPSGPSQAPAQRRRPAVADETSSEDEAFQGEQEGEGGTQAASGHGLGETVSFNPRAIWLRKVGAET